MRHGRKVAVFGSSVALGEGVKGGGWAARLAAALGDRATTLVNLSENGCNTALACHLFPRVVPQERPDVLMISLSLPNERLDLARFQAGISELLRLCAASLPECRVILCGPYPCNLCERDKRVFVLFQQLVEWGRALPSQHPGLRFLDFFSALHRGSGGWPKGTFADDVHPNAKGHELMFRAIDLALFDP
jgi:lysophospholipase L1-like esterase